MLITRRLPLFQRLFKNDFFHLKNLIEHPANLKSHTLFMEFMPPPPTFHYQVYIYQLIRCIAQYRHRYLLSGSQATSQYNRPFKHTNSFLYTPHIPPLPHILNAASSSSSTHIHLRSNPPNCNMPHADVTLLRVSLFVILYPSLTHPRLILAQLVLLHLIAAHKRNDNSRELEIVNTRGNVTAYPYVHARADDL